MGTTSIPLRRIAGRWWPECEAQDSQLPWALLKSLQTMWSRLFLPTGRSEMVFSCALYLTLRRWILRRYHRCRNSPATSLQEVMARCFWAAALSGSTIRSLRSVSVELAPTTRGMHVCQVRKPLGPVLVPAEDRGLGWDSCAEPLPWHGSLKFSPQ